VHVLHGDDTAAPKSNVYMFFSIYPLQKNHVALPPPSPPCAIIPLNVEKNSSQQNQMINVQLSSESSATNNRRVKRNKIYYNLITAV